jgi:hypothetical protein
MRRPATTQRDAALQGAGQQKGVIQRGTAQRGVRKPLGFAQPGAAQRGFGQQRGAAQRDANAERGNSAALPRAGGRGNRVCLGETSKA